MTRTTARLSFIMMTTSLPAVTENRLVLTDRSVEEVCIHVLVKMIIIITIILIKRCSLTRVKLTALYKHLMTKTTLTYISKKRNLKY